MDALGSTLSPSIFMESIDLSGNTGTISFFSSALSANALCEDETNNQTRSSAFPSLKIINLAKCSIGKVDEANCGQLESIGSLLEAINCDLAREKNCCLEINLSGNNVFAEHISVQPIADLIRKGILTKLDLSDNSAENRLEDIKAIADSLKSERCRLSSLNISNCGLNLESVKIIASALLVNTSLTDLNMANNRLGGEGAKAIASALGAGAVDASDINKSLRFLDMSDTNIEYSGAIALLSLTNLTGLRLFGNRIGKSFGKLVQYVGSNKSLKSLDLGGNDSSSNDLLALIETVRLENDTLTLLEIGGNTSTEEVFDAVLLLKTDKPHLDVAHDKGPSGENK